MRQGPVQVDIVRRIGGGRVRSVRATATAIDPNRPINGSYAAFAVFEAGAAASLVYSGHAYFDTAELTFGVGLQGYPVPPDARASPIGLPRTPTRTALASEEPGAATHQTRARGGTPSSA